MRLEGGNRLANHRGANYIFLAAYLTHDADFCYLILLGPPLSEPRPRRLLAITNTAVGNASPNLHAEMESLSGKKRRKEGQGSCTHYNPQSLVLRPALIFRAS